MNASMKMKFLVRNSEFGSSSFFVRKIELRFCGPVVLFCAFFESAQEKTWANCWAVKSEHAEMSVLRNYMIINHPYRYF